MTDPSELPASPLHALCVYAEPLVAGRRVVVLGDATRRLGERFLDLGARVVHLYDPQPARAAAHAERAPRGLTVLPLPQGEFDVRDGAFDLAVVLDLGEVTAPAPLLARIRRLLAPGGAALVRSRSADANARGRSRHGGGGSLDYYELFDLVAMQFAHVRMVGQIPWSGVALAELGLDGDAPAVTVDTQLVTESQPPEAFIAIAGQEDIRLAEYALVQVPAAPSVDVEATIAYGGERAELAAAQLRASLLDAQIEELRAQRNREAVAHTDSLAALEAELADRLSQLQAAEGRLADAAARLERGNAEGRGRDEDLARLRDRTALGLRELEDERRARARAEQELIAARESFQALARDAKVLAVAVDRVPALEVAMAQLEAGAGELSRKLRATEDARGRAESALATAQRELEVARHSRKQETDRSEDIERMALAASRVRELEAEVTELESEVAALSLGHGEELIALESALRERARATHLLEEELLRRERIILDLVHAFDEARVTGAEGSPSAHQGAEQASALRDAESALREARHRTDRARAENEELRARLDAAALEIARREGATATSAWRIQELEQALLRMEDEQSELTMTIPPPAFLHVEREANDVTVLTRRLSTAEDELDIVRQALAQEHDARVRAESGEALTQARTELARQAALLEQLSRELEAHDGVRRPVEGSSDEGATSTAAQSP